MTEIVSIATVPAIVALVNLGKRFGLDGKWAILLAVALGVLLSLAMWAWSDEPWFGAASSGLLLGLGASGLYDLTNQASTKVEVSSTVRESPETYDPQHD